MREHILSALATTGVQAEPLSDTDRHAIFTVLRNRHAVSFTRGFPWDQESAPPGYFNPDAWALIPEYVGASRCLMILADPRQSWWFESGGDLLKVLQECPGFEFYVCDPSANYLLCHNHHEYLIGWGSATEWVASLSSS